MLLGKRSKGTVNSSSNINESEPSENHKGIGEGMTGNPVKKTSVAVRGGPSSHNHFPIDLYGAPTVEVVAEMPHFLTTCGLCKHRLLPGHAIYMYRWYVDTVPIRVFRNYERQGIVYPNQQGVKVYSTLWNADDWATQGGRVKTDWKKAPFTAQYCGFEARACKWQAMVSIYECPYPNKASWWTSPSYKQLSLENQGKMKWVRDNYMIYDYCKDFKRFNGQIPQECYKPQF